MTLLESAIELYKGILAAKPKTDPMFLSFQTFISNHFGHEGFRAMAAVDETEIVFTYKQTGQARPMRAFVHPLNSAKPSASDVQSNPIPTTVTMTGTKEPGNQPTAKVTKSPVLAQKKEVAPSGALGEGNDPSQLENKNPVVAGDATETDTTDNVLTVDIADAAVMRAKAFGEKYTAESMVAWLDKHNVERTGKESRTQLAALIIQSTKPAK